MNQTYEGRPPEFAASDLEPIDLAVEKDIQREMAILRRDMVRRGLKLSVPDGSTQTIELVAYGKPIGDMGDELQRAYIHSQFERLLIRSKLGLN